MSSRYLAPDSPRDHAAARTPESGPVVSRDPMSARLTPDRRARAVRWMALARSIAWALWRDDEAESVAMLALCKALSRYDDESGIDPKAYVSMRIRLAVKRARRSRFVTNQDLHEIPGSPCPESIELPAHLEAVARYRFVDRVSRRATAKALGIPRRLVAEREEAIRRWLQSEDFVGS